MLVTIVDGSGQPHIVTWQGQDQINDFSGALDAPSLAAPKQIAAANSLRAGWLFQNTSQKAMLLFEDGNAVSPWVINSGAFFPPSNYPIPTGVISVQGSGDSQVGDTFTYREWVNAVGE